MKRKLNSELKVFSVRVEYGKMQDAVRLGINTSEVFRKALDEVLKKCMGKCPTCGRSVK